MAQTTTPPVATVGLTMVPTEEEGSLASAVEPPDTHLLANCIKSLNLSSASDQSNSESSSAISVPYPSPSPPIHRTFEKSLVPSHIASSGRNWRHGSELSSSSECHPLVPPSPSMSEGLTDSPSSISSFNSFRKGDLADIEDLDLEPELETVSERDEESSSLCSLDITADMDSDSEHASSCLESDGPSIGLGLQSHGQRFRPATATGTVASDFARRKRGEWYLNNYPSKITSRRPRKLKKGRITEIVEEGIGEINTTVMPKPPFANGSSEWSCEVSGPPVPPPRSISPSDTVPAVPSRLCVCLNADSAANSPITPEKVICTSGSPNHIDKNDNVKAQIPIPGDGNSAANDPSQNSDTEEESASTPLSDRVLRASSRRSPSPLKLRPCFRRRTSTQSTCSARESSCERDPPRGRLVRFSSGPPQEMRTHSPVEYDRKSYPINNRLSEEDVEELRTMKMEMGLLEAKWAAVAACKSRKDDDLLEPTACLSEAAQNAGIAALHTARPEPSDLGSQSDSNQSLNNTSAQMSVATRLRLQKEKEREQERLRNLPHYLRTHTALRRQGEQVPDCISVRSRFGHAPPPPLPGLPPSPGHVAPSFARSSSAPPGCHVLTPRSHISPPSLTDLGASWNSAEPSGVPLLTKTAPSPPLSPGNRKDQSHKCLAPIKNSVSLLGPRQDDGARAAFCQSSSSSPPILSPWASVNSSLAHPAPTYPTIGSYTDYTTPTSEFCESGSEYDLLS